MKSVGLLVALLLWPSSVLAYPGVTVTPDEEKNLNHYVQVLQNMLLSVPTKEVPVHDLQRKPPSNTYSTPPKVSRLKELMSHAEAGAEREVSVSAVSGGTTAFPTGGFTMKTGTSERTKSTAFWQIKPNNVSVVLRAKEPYIEKEEEPEEVDRKLTTASRLSSRVTDFTRSPSSTSETLPAATTKESTDFGLTAELEDVPQLSGGFDVEMLEAPTDGRRQQVLSNNDILQKISDIHAQVQGVPLGGRLNKASREDIQASKDHLGRSIALAAAAEHKLTKMYESQILPLGQTGPEVDNIETIINMLYNSRSKLSEYLNIQYVPPEMREKASTVFSILKKMLCVGGEETQRLIRKLLKNNLKILNLLDMS